MTEPAKRGVTPDLVLKMLEKAPDEVLANLQREVFRNMVETWGTPVTGDLPAGLTTEQRAQAELAWHNQTEQNKKQLKDITDQTYMALTMAGVFP